VGKGGIAEALSFSAVQLPCLGMVEVCVGAKSGYPGDLVCT